MLAFIRQSSKKLRPWLFIAAAVLFFTVVNNVTHIHHPLDDHHAECTFCQHLAFDIPPSAAENIFPHVIISTRIITSFLSPTSSSIASSIAIRAPPLVTPR